MTEPKRTFPWDLLAGAVLLGLLVSMYWNSRSRSQIVLADCPRKALDAPDFTLQFLQVTRTPFQFDEGFVVLPRTAEVERRLLQLLAGLSTHLRLTVQGANASDPSQRIAICVPREDGSVEVAPAGSPALTNAGDQRELVDDLVRQYQTVLAAVQTFRPEVVGSVLPSRPQADLLPAWGFSPPPAQRILTEPGYTPPPRNEVRAASLTEIQSEAHPPLKEENSLSVQTPKRNVPKAPLVSGRSKSPSAKPLSTSRPSVLKTDE